jgi:hypothetical protein
MTSQQAAEQVKKYWQLYPALQSEVLTQVRQEFERHEVEAVEKVIQRLWRDSDVFSFRRLCDALRWESGRKDLKPKAAQAKKQREEERAAADRSFEDAEEAVAQLTEKQFGELIERAVAKRPGLERMLPKVNLRISKIGQALVEEELKSAAK